MDFENKIITELQPRIKSLNELGMWMIGIQITTLSLPAHWALILSLVFTIAMGMKITHIVQTNFSTTLANIHKRNNSNRKYERVKSFVKSKIFSNNAIVMFNLGVITSISVLATNEFRLIIMILS